MPVRITEFSITEEAFDPKLNPIRAKVSLGMRVLTVDDLGFDHKGGAPLHGLPAEQGAPRPARHRRHARRPRPHGDPMSNDQFPPTSRYHDVEIATLDHAPTAARSPTCAGASCRRPRRIALLREHTVRAGERLDQIAATLPRRPRAVLARRRREPRAWRPRS